MVDEIYLKLSFEETPYSYPSNDVYLKKSPLHN